MNSFKTASRYLSGVVVAIILSSTYFVSFAIANDNSSAVDVAGQATWTINIVSDELYNSNPSDE